MCLYLVKEREIVPWAAALRHLNSWKVTLGETNLLPMLNAFLKSLIGPLYNEVGWEDEGTHMQK